MKKIISVILFLVIFFFLKIIPFAAGSSEIYLDTAGTDENGNVFVDVVISGSVKPSMIQFCIAYDSEKLDCISVNAGSAFSGNTAPTINVTEGKIYFIWDSLNPLQKGGTLMSIEFTLKEGSRNASIWIDESEDFIVADESYMNSGVIGKAAEINASAGSGSLSSGEENVSGSLESSVPSDESSKDPETSSENSSVADSSEHEVTSSYPEAETGYIGGIEIEKTQLTISIGEETTIGISGTDKTVFWYSSNEKIVFVEDGKIIPIAPGTATVTVMTEDGLEEAACIVTVVDEEVSGASYEEESSKVIEVDSPRKEKENSVPAWAWAIMAVLGAGIICVSVVLVKKQK